MTQGDDSTRRAVLKLLRRGDATQAEVAGLAGVTRQTVQYWVARAGIDPLALRRRRLLMLWKRLTGTGESPG
jgi:transposase